MTRKVILVLGGTGRLGSVVAKYLVKDYGSRVSVLLAGRSASRGREIATSIGAEFIQLNIQDTEAIKKVLRENRVATVFNAVGPFHQQQPTIIRAAIDERVPYIDVCDDINGFAAEAKKLHAEAAAAGVPCITTAGVFPGLANLVMADLCDQAGGKGHVEELKFRYFMAGSCGFGVSVMVSTMNGMLTDVTEFIRGKKVSRMPFTGREVVPFVEPVGSRPVYYLELPEAISMQQTYDVPNVSLKFGTAPDFFNWATLFSGIFLGWWMRKSPQNVLMIAEQGLKMCGPIDPLVGRKFAMQLTCKGTDGVVRVHESAHADGYEGTGVATAWQIMAMVDGDVPPGVWYPEEGITGKARDHIVDLCCKHADAFKLTTTSKPVKKSKRLIPLWVWALVFGYLFFRRRA